MKFRKKPVVIEAEIWDGSFTGDVKRFTSGSVFPAQSPCEHCDIPLGQHGRIPTLEGSHIVCPGDWIITGVQGERYLCKPDIFEQTYEPVVDEEEENESDD